MKKFRDKYQEEFKQYDVSEVLIEKTKLKMKEVEGKSRRRSLWKMKGVVAAACMIITLTGVVAIAATYWSPHESTPSRWIDEFSGNNVPANPLNKVMQKDNMKFTFDNIIVDEDKVMIKVYVESLDKTPISNTNELINSYLGQQGFKSVKLYCDGKEISTHGSSARMDDGSVPYKATYNITCEYTGDIAGNNLKIQIEDIVGCDWISESIGFKFDSVYDMIQDEELLSEKEFTDILPAGDKKIYFSDKYPEAYIDNIGIAPSGEMNYKRLYISIVPGNEESAKALMERLMYREPDGSFGCADLFNEEGKNLYETEDGRLIMTINTERNDDLIIDNLKYVTLALNNGEEDVTYASGIWDLDFMVDAKNIVSKQIYTGMDFEYNDGSINFSINEMVISSNGMKMKGDMSKISGEKSFELKIVMKDGTEVNVEKLGHIGDVIDGHAIQNEYDMEGRFTQALNTGDVVGMKINETYIDLMIYKKGN